jgi:hypothetical protein
MAAGVYINPAAMTAAQYDQTMERLDAAVGGMLMPIIQELGVDPGPHTVEPVHNRVPVTPSG